MQYKHLQLGVLLIFILLSIFKLLACSTDAVTEMPLLQFSAFNKFLGMSRQVDINKKD